MSSTPAYTRKLTFLGWIESQGFSFNSSTFSQIFASSDHTPFKSCSSSNPTWTRSSLATNVPEGRFQEDRSYQQTKPMLPKYHHRNCFRSFNDISLAWMEVMNIVECLSHVFHLGFFKHHPHSLRTIFQGQNSPRQPCHSTFYPRYAVFKKKKIKKNNLTEQIIPGSISSKASLALATLSLSSFSLENFPS